MTPAVMPKPTTEPLPPDRASKPTPARGMRSERHRVLAADGVELSLTRVVGTEVVGNAVVVTHGTFSNAGICLRLADYLARHGTDCWVLELRGHGASQRAVSAPSFEAFGLFDVPAALKAVRAHTGRPLLLVGHSGGGLAFLMHLVRQPSARPDVRGVVLLGCQATEACATWSGRMFVAFGRLTDLTLGLHPRPRARPRARGRGRGRPDRVVPVEPHPTLDRPGRGRLPGRAREPLGAGALRSRRGRPVHRASRRLPAALRRLGRH